MKNASFLFFSLLILLPLPCIPACKGGEKDILESTRNAKLLSWDRIFSAKGLVGYLEKKQVSDSEKASLITFVRDPKFRCVGVITDTGKAYRYDREGNTEFLSSSTMENNVKLILGMEGDIFFQPGIR